MFSVSNQLVLNQIEFSDHTGSRADAEVIHAFKSEVVGY
jgi:hypothetical protein